MRSSLRHPCRDFSFILRLTRLRVVLPGNRLRFFRRAYGSENARAAEDHRGRRLVKVDAS